MLLSVVKSLLLVQVLLHSGTNQWGTDGEPVAPMGNHIGTNGILTSIKSRLHAVV